MARIVRPVGYSGTAGTTMKPTQPSAIEIAKYWPGVATVNVAGEDSTAIKHGKLQPQAPNNSTEPEPPLLVMVNGCPATGGLGEIVNAHT